METRHFEESMLMSSFDLKSIKKKKKKRKPSSRLASLYLGVEKGKKPCCVFSRVWRLGRRLPLAVTAAAGRGR